jgi:hypothetical protein
MGMLSNLKSSFILQIFSVVLSAISISSVGYATPDNISFHRVPRKIYCANYANAVSTLKKLNQSGYTPFDLDQFSNNCPVPKNNITFVLSHLFDYAELQEKRDLPNSMARMSNNSNSVIKDSISSKMNSILTQLKSLPDKTVLPVLSYVVANDSDDYMYSGAALEIVARIYPDRYYDYKRYFSSDLQGLSMWKQVRDQWIANKSVEHK